MKSDSGVVTRMWGRWRVICWRSHCGVSPVRRAARMGASGMPRSRREGGDFGQRDFEVLVDVVAERLERGDVHDLRLVGERAEPGPPHQGVDSGQERGQRFTGAGGSGDEDVAPFANERPTLHLGFGQAVKTRSKPFGYKGVELGKHFALSVYRTASFRPKPRNSLMLQFGRNTLSRGCPSYGTGKRPLPPGSFESGRSRNSRGRHGAGSRARHPESQGRERPGAVRHDRHREPRVLPAETPEEYR